MSRHIDVHEHVPRTVVWSPRVAEIGIVRTVIAVPCLGYGYTGCVPALIGSNRSHTVDWSIRTDQRGSRGQRSSTMDKGQIVTGFTVILPIGPAAPHGRRSEACQRGDAADVQNANRDTRRWWPIKRAQ